MDATPATDMPAPPLLAVVYGDGWRQRSTLAFGAKSLVLGVWEPQNAVIHIYPRRLHHM